MSYHRFPNLRDIFQSHLSAKMIEDAELVSFLTQICNCKASPGQAKKNPKEKTPCHYDKICRVPIMIYKVTCTMTGKIYIGNTQQYFKTQMKGHFQDVNTLVNKGIYSDSYAHNFANLAPPGAKGPTPGMQRDMIASEIIWKGNPMTVVKSFGKNSCKLCSRERMEIIKHLFNPECPTINSRLEIHGACRHLP
jgi:hypothetical protein